jgi:uncharacterized membrane protein
MRFNPFAALLPLALTLASANASSAEPRDPARLPPAALECVAGDLRTANPEFRAGGLEPAWTLELDGAQCLAFSVQDTGVLVFAALPETMAVMKAGGALYGVRTRTHELQIGIERRNCPGVSNGSVTTHTVTIRLNGQEYRGCGGALADAGEQD